MEQDLVAELQIVNNRMTFDNKPVIEVRGLSSEKGDHRYLVRDNGAGIPADILDNVFVPFVRGAETGETGIGLSIVEKTVKTYNGEIKAYNNNGACFEFTLKDFDKD